jgi:hypothetical protein
MNDKITFHNIAAAIATATGCTDEEAAQFLRALLDKAGDALADGERVTIKGVGTFAPGEPSQEPVIWAPDTLLADTVNEPFAAFEPVALASGITEEQLLQPVSVAAEHEAAPEAEETPAEEVATAEVPSAEVVEQTPAEAEPTVTQATTVTEAPAAPEEVATPKEPEAVAPAEERLPAVEPTEPEEYAYTEPEPNENSGINPWLMLIIGLLVGLAIGYFIGTSFGYLFGSDTEVSDDEELVEATDSVVEEAADTTDGMLVVESDEVDTVEAATPAVEQPKQEAAQAPAPAASPAVVTDTVKARRYLTTMARKYYGDHCFWVYIYEENADRISNPDRIAPGTVVVIPPASKYGIDASNAESVRRAKAKIGELERRKK